MSVRNTLLWTLGIATLIGGAFYYRYVPPSAEVEGQQFFYAYDEPFLVPDRYIHNRTYWERRYYPGFFFYAAMPGLTPDAAEAEAEWAIGSPRMVSVLVESAKAIFSRHPENIGKMTTPEFYTQNLTTGPGREKPYAEWTDAEKQLRQEWLSFVAANRDREWELIDVGDRLYLSRPLDPNSVDFETHYVAFSGGRLVVFVSCSKPETVPSPSCSGIYHRPGDAFEIRADFSRVQFDHALDIIQGCRDLLNRFNEAGKNHLKNNP